MPLPVHSATPSRETPSPGVRTLTRRSVHDVVRRACAIATCVIGLGACSDDAGSGVTGVENAEGDVDIRIVASSRPSAVEKFVAVERPVVVEVRDARGRLVRGALLGLGGTTGLLSLPAHAGLAGRWFAPNEFLFTTDSSGRAALRWLPDDRDEQKLRVQVMGNGLWRRSDSVVLAAVGTLVPVQADEVVPASVFATCVRQGTTVACTGRARLRFGAHGVLPADPDMVDEAIGTLRPVALPGPARRLHATERGPCAELVDGRFACWTALGPRGTVPVVEGLPPLRDQRRGYGLATDGTFGIIAPPTGAPATAAWRWRPLATDPSLVRVASHGAANHACAITVGGRVRCLEPRERELRDLRDPPDTTLRATEAYVADTRELGILGMSAITLREPATGRRVRWLVGESIPPGGTVWPVLAPSPTAVDEGIADDGTAACVPRLAACDGRPWRSVSRMGVVHPTSSRGGGGSRRTCAIRDGVWCEFEERGGGSSVFAALGAGPLRVR